ncbi:TonB-dependent receptor family protein [Cognatiluteimonas telluris]|uniref:TonB-dependent receptor family protein n=1 Tax=Cognatiluteimonas telluris TaxID=1104775 RepID=UPI0024344DE9|nr:TonB-dependent receptor [Lysobacter telluris]
MSQTTSPRWRAVAGMGLACVLSTPAGAHEPAGTATLPGIVVVGQRTLQGTPASLDRVHVADVPARAQRSVSEVLERVPGVAAHDRQSHAQDVQLTIRGFGARSAFGVRGLQVFADGIPATMPDGQGQVSHVPLEALDRVEVLRGPFSALYGNAAGGVIEFFSADPPARMRWSADMAGGSDGLLRESLSWAGPWSDAQGAGGDDVAVGGDHGGSAGVMRDDHGLRAGTDADGSAGGNATPGTGYRLDASHFATGGYRRHSRAQRDTAQARLLFASDRGMQLALTANTLALSADDPQGLTWAQARAAPRAASAGALAFDTRKRVRQSQVGLQLVQALGDAHRLRLETWGGQRDTFQMLSIPAMAQVAPGSGGGVIDLARTYAGVDLRWQLDAHLRGRALGLTVGIESQRSSEHRLGFENFVGDTLGVVGALRRDQRDRVANRDAYAELRWAFAPRWSATAGIRHSRIDFRSRDAYIAPGNPDDSGALHYAQTTPVVGVAWQATPWLEVYGNAGRGFETPSFAELGYRADGRSGLNDALRPARTHSAELGLRGQRGAHAFDLVAFASRTRDELVVASNLGGRSTYTNAATTRRRGWELSASGPLAARWRYALAYSRLDARYLEGFGTCRAPPCAQPDTYVAAGNRIPATAPQSLWAQLRYAPTPVLDLFAQASAVARIQADDGNTADAPGYALLDLGAERHWRIGRMTLDGFVRLDNVLDRHAIGAVIVNDANGRYFEPAPGRGWVLGLSLRD